MDILQDLENIYNTNPETPSLDLDFKQISDLQPLLNLLCQFQELKDLSLHGNRIKQLPEDLSILEGIEILDLSNNLITNIQNIVRPLNSMKTLKDLSITLKNPQQDKQFLFQNLKNLEVLNGEQNPFQNQNQQQQQQQQNQEYQNDQDQEGGFENQQNQNGLPQFNQNNLQQNYQNEQMNQNNFDGENYDNNNNQQSDQQFNENDNESEMNSQMNDINLKQEDLETVAILYDNIRELFRVAKMGDDKQLAFEFDEHVKEIMMDLSIKIKEQNQQDHIINNNVLTAKYALFEICFDKTLQLLSSVDPRVVQVVQTLHDQHAIIFKDMSSVIENFQAKSVEQQNLNLEKLNLQNQKQQIQNDQNNNSQNQNQAIEHWREENQELRDQIAQLQEENQKYLDMIIKRSKGDNNVSNMNNTLQKEGSPSQKNSNNNMNIQNQTNYNQQQSVYSNLHQGSPSHPLNQSQMSKYGSKMNLTMQNSVVGTTQTRTLTIKQLKDVIEEIYSSKQKYDQKYLDAKLPRETMEQHMYTYLNQRYGLKSLIIEWATAIINGIRNFSQEDNDIAVFGKILRNENDEEFRFVQSQVKNTIGELLKMYLRGKYPFKHNSEIKQMLMQKINGWVFEEEATDIIKYMYSQEDAEQLIQKLKNSYQVHNQKSRDELKKLTREEQMSLLQEKEKLKIQYFEFQKIILDFQLQSHEKFLKRFIGMFRQVDSDHNGLIDENEFRQLLELMGEDQNEERVQKFLNTVDPYNHQQIPFSQCVTLFSSEVVQDSQGQISILQKLAMENMEDMQQ